MKLRYYADNFNALVAECEERQIAVQTIKSIALRPWMGRERTHSTWYQPLDEQSDIDLAVGWVLGRPGLFLNSVGDVDLLPMVLDAAERFDGRIPGEDAMRRLEEGGRAEPLFV